MSSCISFLSQCLADGRSSRSIGAKRLYANGSNNIWMNRSARKLPGWFMRKRSAAWNCSLRQVSAAASGLNFSGSGRAARRSWKWSRLNSKACSRIRARFPADRRSITANVWSIGSAGSSRGRPNRTMKWKIKKPRRRFSSLSAYCTIRILGS